MPRTLTDDQKATITDAIGTSGNLQLLIDGTVDDASAYALEIANVFSAAGWGVETQSLETPWGSTPSGIAFLSQGDLPVNDIGQTLCAALERCGIEFSRMDAMLPEGVDVKLLVGRVGV